MVLFHGYLHNLLIRILKTPRIVSSTRLLEKNTWCRLNGRFARQSDNVQDSVPAFQGYCEWLPNGILQDSDLPEVIGMAPCSLCTGREEGDISRTVTMFHTLVVDHDALAGKYDVSFVLRVVPLVTYGATLPQHGVRQTVTRLAKQLAASCGIAAQEPLRWNQAGFECRVGQSRR